MAVFCKSKKSLFSPLLNQPLPLVARLPGALASAIHYTSTFCRAPLVRLVVMLPSAPTLISLQRRLVALASTSCCSPCSLQRLALSAIHLCFALRPSHLFVCCISQRLSLLCCAPLVWLVVAYHSASASPSYHASPFLLS